MITLLAALLFTGPSIIELPEPDASYITVQAVVKLGELSGRREAMAKTVDDILADATQNFNEDQLRVYSSLTGESLHCSLSADHFRIQLEVPKGRMDLAGEIISDLLRYPRFEHEVLASELQAAPQRPRSVWSELMSPYRLDFAGITRDALLDFYSHAVTPETTTIAIAGPFSPGDGVAAVEKYLSGWEAPKPVPSYGRVPPPESPPALLARHSFPISSMEIYGPSYAASGADFPAQLLAATALGVGKASAMHQTLREKLGLSYEQLAVIEPSPEGFTTHLIMLRSPSGNEIALLDTMRQALTEAVQGWTEGDRTRALGMAKAYLTEHAPATPLFFDSDTFVGDSMEDNAFLQAYWQEKTGGKWDPAGILSQMQQVTLSQMKEVALSFLKDAQGGVILGSEGSAP